MKDPRFVRPSHPVNKKLLILNVRVGLGNEKLSALAAQTELAMRKGQGGDHTPRCGQINLANK